MNNEELAKMDLADLEIEYRQVVMQRDDLLRELNTAREGGSLIYEISKDQSKTIKWALEQLKTVKVERDALRAENERLSGALEKIVEASEMHTQFIVSLEKEEVDYTAFQGGVCHGRELAAHIARKALEGGDE